MIRKEQEGKETYELSECCSVFLWQMLTQYQLSKNSSFQIQITFIDKIVCKMVNIMLN